MSWSIIKQILSSTNHKELERELYGTIEEHKERPVQGRIEVNGKSYNTIKEAELDTEGSLWWARKNQVRGQTNRIKIRENENFGK